VTAAIAAATAAAAVFTVRGARGLASRSQEHCVCAALKVERSVHLARLTDVIDEALQGGKGREESRFAARPERMLLTQQLIQLHSEHGGGFQGPKPRKMLCTDSTRHMLIASS